MLRVRVMVTMSALLLAAPALAQTDTQGPPRHILGKLPADAALMTAAAAPADMAPPDENAPPAAFIQQALRAIAAGRLPEAQNAIEQAESRALTRSVAPSQAEAPSQQPLVRQLSQARQALDGGDKLAAVHMLEAAAKNPQAGGK